MKLQRTLGWKEATSLGIGAMVGAGIFVLSGVATGKAGPAVMISFIIAALLAMLLGVCYAELSSRYPRAGGSYEYVRETMGPLIGTIIDRSTSLFRASVCIHWCTSLENTWSFGCSRSFS